MFLSHWLKLAPVQADQRRGCGWDRFVESQRSPLTRILPHYIVSRVTVPMADDAECTLEVVNALSGQSLCSLQLPGSRSVLEVKRRLRADLGVGIFCQRLLLGQAGRSLEDREVLASLAPRSKADGEPLDALVLSLLRLSHVKTDLVANRRLLRAARTGASADAELLLRLPLGPDCNEEELRLRRGGGREGGRRRPRFRSETVGTTPLILASYAGHQEVVRLLCEAGANKDRATPHGRRALILASAEGHLEVVRLLCEAAADKEKADNYGFTALMRASSRGHLEMVRLLCEAGADKEKADISGLTALMCASTRGHLEVVRLLCKAGADRDRGALILGSRTTALQLASKFGYQDIVDLLLEPRPWLAKRPRYDEGSDMT